MPMNVKVSGSWRDVTPYVKVSGSWRSIDKAWVKVAGTWRVIYKSLTIEYAGGNGSVIKKYDIGGNEIESFSESDLNFSANRSFIFDNQNICYYCTSSSEVIKYNFDTATVEWTYTVPNSNNAGEILVDSNYNVYFFEQNNDVWTKLDSSGNIQWQRDISPYSANEYGSLILDNDDIVYFSFDSGDGNERMQRITPSNGTVWSVTSTPSNSIHFMRVLENDVSRAFGITAEGVVVDINLNDGSATQLFSATEIGPVPNGFDVDIVNNRIYISSVSPVFPEPSNSDEGLFSYDFNGNLQWNRDVFSRNVIVDPNGDVLYSDNDANDFIKMDYNQNVIWNANIYLIQIVNVPYNTLLY